MPKQHNSHYENIQKNEIDELGTVLKSILLKLEVALDDPPYNYIIHTSPFDTQALPHYHWHMEIIPRLTRVAGLRVGHAASTSTRCRRNRRRRSCGRRPSMFDDPPSRIFS